MTVTAALWRRLEMPGYDACRLVQGSRGWRLGGCNVSRGPAAVSYSVECDERWRSERGRVGGWTRRGDVDVTIERDHGVWLFNGTHVGGLDDCLDLDFGFTPATNLFQLRRIALEIGEAADVPVAWFDLGETTLRRVDQRYERRGENTYWYESPSFGYAAQLEIAASGFVRRYPDLWELDE